VKLHEAKTSLWIVAFTALVVAVAAFLASSVVPSLIASAYRGESVGLLSWIIEGQSLHPVEYYLSRWDAVARRALAALLGLGLLLALVSWPPLQRAVDARVGAPPSGTDPEARWRIGRGRLLLACALFALLAGAQLIDVALQEEHWPFSDYSMYAGKQADSFTWVQAYGVTPSGEVFLDPSTYFQPFDHSRLPVALERHVLHGPDQQANTRRALENLYELYERGRRSGAHAGPPLLSLRLYRVNWRIDPKVANKHHPEQKELLDELPTA
jgi:hypothetical protein